MACDVVAHTEVRLPQLAHILCRGCFEKPCVGKSPSVRVLTKRLVSKPLKLFCIASVQIIHLPEVQDPQGQPICVPSQIKMEHCYAKGMLHPVTQSVNRYVVGDSFHDGPKSAQHEVVS